jgi:hypothetical protein
VQWVEKGAACGLFFRLQTVSSSHDPNTAAWKDKQFQKMSRYFGLK